MKIKYNAPATLTLAFVATVVLILNQTIFPGITKAFFCTPGKASFSLHGLLDFFRLFGHIFGHADWNHLLGNLSYILLIGPLLEENFGSLTMAVMIFITALVTGVLNVLLFSTGLMGASGIVFMMILLASVTNTRKDEIPLSFILIVILYLGREVLGMFKNDNISEFAHLAGGFCGSVFGFMKTAGTASSSKRTASKKNDAVNPGFHMPSVQSSPLHDVSTGSETDIDITEFLPQKSK